MAGKDELTQTACSSCGIWVIRFSYNRVISSLDLLYPIHASDAGSTWIPGQIEIELIEVGVYSAGINNQYGYPCAGTISRLNQYGVLVLSTDVYGSIIVTVSQVGYRITDSAG
jgi:hypothetical protein